MRIERGDPTHRLLALHLYDGLHIEHRAGDEYDGRKWNLLDQAMRAAEQAVKTQTGFTIKLVEKRLCGGVANLRARAYQDPI